MGGVGQGIRDSHMDHLRAGQRQSWDPWADDLEAGQRTSETLDGQLGHWTRPKGQNNPSGPLEGTVWPAVMTGGQQYTGSGWNQEVVQLGAWRVLELKIPGD